MPFYNDVTLELRNKLRRELDIIEDELTGNGNHLATVGFNNSETHLAEECKTWLGVITKLFRTSYDCYRLTKLGRFRGVRPKEVYDNFAVFSVVAYKKESWIDWFDITGENDGPLQGTMGLVINKRTHPEYYKDGKYIWEKEK